MQKIFEIIPVYVEQMPSHNDKKDGILYISKKYGLAIHLCACGCGGETVTPLDEWTLTEQNGLCTLRPSIGNFMGENPYHAHYYVTNNKIEWL